MNIAKKAQSVTTPLPSNTDGWKKEYPFNMMFRTAIDEKVNGMQYEKYCRNHGIPWMGQNIPKTKSNNPLEDDKHSRLM